MKAGVYYNDITHEITSVTNSDLPSGAGWTHLTDEAQLGLLAVRAMLIDRGLVDDDRAVYWHLPQPERAEGLALVCEPPDKKTRGLRGGLWSVLRGNERQQLSSSSAKGSA